MEEAEGAEAEAEGAGYTCAGERRGESMLLYMCPRTAMYASSYY
jgi:hypothetical protein